MIEPTASESLTVPGADTVKLLRDGVSTQRDCATGLARALFDLILALCNAILHRRENPIAAAIQEPTSQPARTPEPTAQNHTPRPPARQGDINASGHHPARSDAAQAGTGRVIPPITDRALHRAAPLHRAATLHRAVPCRSSQRAAATPTLRVHRDRHASRQSMHDPPQPRALQKSHQGHSAFARPFRYDIVTKTITAFSRPPLADRHHHRSHIVTPLPRQCCRNQQFGRRHAVRRTQQRRNLAHRQGLAQPVRA